VQPAVHRELIQSDDWITKFQGTWVSVQGTTMFVQARYVAWMIFGFVFPAVLGIDYLMTGSVSLLPLTDASIAVVATYGIANLTNGEVTLAHAGIYAGRLGRQLATRLRRRVSTPVAERSGVTRDRLRVRIVPGSDTMPAPRTLVRRAPDRGGAVPVLTHGVAPPPGAGESAT
jgi:hypothetical protein